MLVAMGLLPAMFVPYIRPSSKGLLIATTKNFKKKIIKKMEMKSKWFSVFLNSLELEG